MDRASELATPSATRNVLELFGLSPKKSFGQNFLVNDDVIKKILDLADVGFTDVVLEVGPGIGTLSSALLKHVSELIAVERDPDLPVVLQHTLQQWEGRYRVIKKDALDLKLSDLGESRPNKFVANLPYSVAATLVLDYFWRFESIDNAIVMVQKEVAERMMAEVGTKDYGAYTVKLSMIARPQELFIVKPENFMPRPHVDSAVIRLNRVHSAMDETSMELMDIAALMADAAFASRRKTIANSMRMYLKGKGSLHDRIFDLLPTLFHEVGIDPGIRGERLSVDQYLDLARVFIEKTS